MSSVNIFQIMRSECEVVISIFNEKLVKHVFDDYLGNGEVDVRLSSMSPTIYKLRLSSTTAIGTSQL